jgi:hypothetical protein
MGAIFRGFTTRWSVGTSTRTITLPLVQSRAEGELSYNCTVNWGDGTITTVTSYNDPNATHTYSANGTYNIEIRGTCEGWSINGSSIAPQILAVVYWGKFPAFNGFKYLSGGFNGCTNLTSIASGPIPASGTGILTDGFYNTFNSCDFTTIPAGLFDQHPNVTEGGFEGTFYDCSITSIPSGLFKVHTSLNLSAFNSTFAGSLITSIPSGLFNTNIAVSSDGFYQTFYLCSNLTAIPSGLFTYNTAVSKSGFYQTFCECTALLTVPAGLFDNNVAASDHAFFQTFYGCTALTTVPTGLFRNNTNVTTQGFYETFYGCTKLQLNANIWYNSGEETTRFLNISSNFTSCFQRTSFSGTQGTAPDLWNCNFGETITLSTAPATAWVAGDVITGQTSGATATVVSQVSSLVYQIYQHVGTFTLGESVGVTGVPAKIAPENGSHPIFTGQPVSLDCFHGAGNSATSLTNYSSIPSNWK